MEPSRYQKTFTTVAAPFLRFKSNCHQSLLYARLPSMSELPKAYDPKAVDPKWYQFWLDQGFFTADAHSTKPAYCIVIPPPNVTGVLHMGHALVNTLQDMLIRWKRMSALKPSGYRGQTMPALPPKRSSNDIFSATTGKRRTDFSREEFLRYIWQWKEENEKNILNQLKKLGCSCDWTRLRFTMDEGQQPSCAHACLKSCMTRG